MNKNYYCVIMAGGIGSRFWPKSRNAKPKQFLDILGIGKSFLQQTFDRFASVIPRENIFIVTGSAYVSLVNEQISGLAPYQIIAEPDRRNTAPCIAYAAYKILEKTPEATIIVTPSDHLILNEAEFLRITRQAMDFASSDNVLVTIGIKPTRPETGYGLFKWAWRQSLSSVYAKEIQTADEEEEIVPEMIKKQLFWIYYPDARKVLANTPCFVGESEVTQISFDDLFQKRRFSSYIRAISNNQNNRQIHNYTRNGMEAMLESERLKQEIFNFESDLWEY